MFDGKFITTRRAVVAVAYILLLIAWVALLIVTSMIGPHKNPRLLITYDCLFLVGICFYILLAAPRGRHRSLQYQHGLDWDVETAEATRTDTLEE